MSGGHYEYEQYKIDQVAYQMKKDIENNGETHDPHNYVFDFTKETMEYMKKVSDIVALAGILTKHADWLYSGDDSEETFRENIEKALLEYNSVSKIDCAYCDQHHKIIYAEDTPDKPNKLAYYICGDKIRPFPPIVND